MLNKGNVNYGYPTYLPSQSAPTILKNRAPCFLRNGAPCFLQKAGWKKQGHSLFKKRRDQAASSLFELQWPWIFALCFFQKAGCPILKNSMCRLTGQMPISAPNIAQWATLVVKAVIGPKIFGHFLWFRRLVQDCCHTNIGISSLLQWKLARVICLVLQYALFIPFC